VRHPLPTEAAAAELGLRIRHHRLRRRMTQQQLAEGIGVKRPQVSGWETGVKHPSLGSLLLTGKTLDVDPGALVRGLHRL